MKTTLSFCTVILIGVILCGLNACTQETEAGDSVTAFSGSFVRQGKAVFDLSGYRIAYYEPAAYDRSADSSGQASNAGVIQESNEPFIMADYGPRDTLPSEIKKPSIYAVFSQPVVPLAQLGEAVRDETGPFTIEPPLAGVYRWYGSRLLSFEPDAEFLPQRRYTVTVSDRITSLGGKELQGPRSFSFETERLSVLEWQLGGEGTWVPAGNAHPDEAKFIRMIFSHPVQLEEIVQWIDIQADGLTMPFTLGRLPQIDEQHFHRDQGVLVSIGKELPLDTDVVMTLKMGARSEPDSLGTTEDASWSFHTLLPFTFTGATVHRYPQPWSPLGDSISIYLEFNQQIAVEGVEQFISVDGFPPLKKENVQVYDSTVEITGLPLEYETTYTVQISEKLRDRYSRRLDKAETITADTGEPASYVHIRDQGSAMLEAGYPPKIVWSAQNPVSLQFGAASAQGPYERLPLSALKNVNIADKQFFMEDLGPFLNAAGKGSIALRWDYKFKSSWDPGRIFSRDLRLNVQVTNIGITVRYAYNMALVWATHLSDGSPAANARVELLETEETVAEGITDEQGLAVFTFSDGDFLSRLSEPDYWSRDSGIRGLRVRVSEGNGNSLDRAEFVPNDSHNLWRFDVQASVSPFKAEQERPVVFLFSDRGLYRPGETVSFRGVDRSLRLGQYAAYQGPYQIEVNNGGYRAPALVTLNGEVTANGGFHGEFTLPDTLNPGTYYINYRRGIDNADKTMPQQTMTFTVAHFERLRFESSLQFADTLVYQGDKLNAALAASWLSGGGLSGAPFTWHLTREPASFIPGDADGMWRNWRFGPELNDERIFAGRGEGSLGPDGKAHISTDTRSDGIKGAAYRYGLEAAVQDTARQEIASNDTVLVHPASFYIAARLDSEALQIPALPSTASPTPSPSASFVSAGNPATLNWALVSPQGELWQDKNGSELLIRLLRHEWKQAQQEGVGGRINLVWEQVEEIVEEQTVRTETPNGMFGFVPDRSGLWEIRIEGSDPEGRLAATSFSFYVSGAGWVRWGSASVDTILLTTDRPAYAPGETAQILVRSPLEKGKYLLTLEREGIISQQIIELEGSALTIDIPVIDSYMPVVYAALSSYTVRSGPPNNTYHEPDLDKPKGVFGVTPIYVDHSSRHYQIEIETVKDVYRPAEDAEVKIKVLLNGNPAPDIELSFMAVDRGVLDLVNYHVPDPAAFFYDPRHFPLGVRGADSRSLLIDPVTYSLSDLAGGDSEDDGKMEESLAGAGMSERADFRPTAVFEPYLLTGSDGTATVKFTLPDSLTTYRCTAVAAGPHEFGIAEHELQVSAPLTATPALPRKLRWRDTGSVSLILTNLTQTPVEAKTALAVSANTIIEIDGDNSKTVKILPDESAEVMFRVAAVGVGEAELAFTLQSPLLNERIIKTISVDRPTVIETVTVTGNLGPDDAFIEEGIVLPSLVPEGTGSVELSLSASRLAALKETFNYLLDYPYGCIEQRTARLLPLIAFGDYLQGLDLAGPVPDAQFIEKELTTIAQSQLADGSFPYWPGGQYGDVFVSIRVAHIAALVQAKGMTVPVSLDTRRLLAYINTAANDTSALGKRLARDPFLKGYSLWVRAMHGERIGSEISAFLKQGDELGISGWAFAGLAAMELGQKDLAASTRDRVRRFIRPGTRTLDLTDTYERQGNYWGYDSDRYALALMLFHSLDTADEQTSRLAASLIDRQRGGVWNNTASSFWALLALGMLGDTEAAEWESNTGQLSVAVNLGETGLFNTEFASYASAPVSYNGTFAEAPVIDLPRDTLLPLRIERNGTGRLYYTASLRYGIPVELAGARDEGLGVFVETFDVEGNTVNNGRLQAGKTYTRRVTVSSSRDRNYVALRSPIPSGAEIIDATFVTSSTVPPPEEFLEEADGSANAEQDYMDWEYYNPPPVRFVMDDEVRFHWDHFRAGRQQVEFRFRAVMPGVYPTPPASAECMYEPEVFGRTAGELVRIE